MDKNVFDVILIMLASGMQTSIQTTDITMKIIHIAPGKAACRDTRVIDRISVYE
jgi:hypothetical protein